MKLHQLFENYHYAPLYHGTSLWCAALIINSNIIYRSHSVDTDYECVSLTRLKSFTKNYEVAFKFDQAKLRTKYKMIPFSGEYGTGGLIGRVEGEEALIGNISPVTSYLISYTVEKTCLSKEYLEYTIHQTRVGNEYTYGFGKITYDEMKQYIDDLLNNPLCTII